MRIEPNGVCRVVCLMCELLVALTVSAVAEEPGLCQMFGPQSPRDIMQTEGTNPIVFSFAPPPAAMNLCNVHFHLNAEHKGPVPAFNAEVCSPLQVT